MNTQRLPVSIIVPTRNCAATLSEHLEKMRPVLDCASEVIGVDGSSEDGTAEILKKYLNHRVGAKFLSLPAGLYEGWNAAVAEAGQPWVYFSTIGDFIELDGLRELLVRAESGKLDLLISPPRMMEEDGVKSSSRKWPIHYLAEAFNEKETRLLSLDEKILGFFSFFTASILGSSASNIYSTSFLRKHPFATDFGHAGDTIWAVRYFEKMQVGICPVPVATFRCGWKLKESDAVNQRLNYLKMCEEAEKQVKNISTQINNHFFEGWFSAYKNSNLVLWDWLASQADLAADHHALVEDMKKMEAELNRRIPERIFNAISRRISKTV